VVTRGIRLDFAVREEQLQADGPHVRRDEVLQAPEPRRDPGVAEPGDRAGQLHLRSAEHGEGVRCPAVKSSRGQLKLAADATQGVSVEDGPEAFVPVY